MRQRYIYLTLFCIILGSLKECQGLDPGIFNKNRAEKIRILNEQNEEGRKQTIFHTLSQLGEQYMDVMKFFSENVVNRIQDYLSLDYYLIKKQSQFQHHTSGYQQNLYHNDMETQEYLSNFIPKSEHRTARFRMLTEQQLQKERDRNKDLGRIFNHEHRMKQNPSVQTVDESQSYIEHHNQINKRLLQPNHLPNDGEIIKFGPNDKCKNGSQIVVIQQTTYFCNFSIIQEQDYLQMTDEDLKKNNCATRNLKFEACLCPIDYIGRRCEFETRIYCQIDFINRQQCPEMDSFEYVSQYSGLPPCVTINSQDFLQFTVKAVCRNLIDILPGPKVYNTNQDMVILYDEKPPSADSSWQKFTKFTYLLDNPTLKISRLRKLFPQILYINWNNLGENVKDSYEQKFSLSLEQLSGQKTFEIALNFRKLNQNITTSGRYTIEFNLFEKFQFESKDPFVMSASDVTMLTFEDDQYIEPQSKQQNTTLIIIIAVLSIVIILGIAFTVYYFYRQKKNKLKVRNQSALDDNSLNQNLAEWSPQRDGVAAQDQDQIQEEPDLQQ